MHKEYDQKKEIKMDLKHMKRKIIISHLYLREANETSMKYTFLKKSQYWQR